MHILTIRSLAAVVGLAVALVAGSASAQQVLPPGSFSINGTPVACGQLPTILAPPFNDVAFNNGSAIILNERLFFSLPVVAQFFWYAHECGHAFVGTNEDAADCWAVRTGRDQGWFPVEAFRVLVEILMNNPGDATHRPGPQRVENMWACYNTR